MFKLVVLSCLVSVAFGGYIAAPASYAQIKTVVEPQVSVVQTPTIEHVGTSFKNVPTGVSHHSSSVVHSSANIVEPIYAHGVQKTIVSTPVVKKIVEHVPAVVPVAKYAYAEPSYIAAPVAKYASYAAPAYTVAAPAHYAHAAPAHYAHAAPAHYAHAAPLAYSSAQYAHVAPAHYAHAAPLAYSSAVYAPKTVSYASAYPSAYAHQW